LSHLNVVGLGELVADGPESYLRIARDLSRDLSRLAAIRAGLRDRLRASPLLKSVQFTRALEAAFREMWNTWCGRDGQ
jgi:predicted O-linked N-acetylglucosamine transferase (SPINDLY family)